jgi:hypothetical protein
MFTFFLENRRIADGLNRDWADAKVLQSRSFLNWPNDEAKKKIRIMGTKQTNKAFTMIANQNVFAFSKFFRRITSSMTCS